MSDQPAADTLRRTCLYEEHERLSARMVPFAGWMMPVQYTGIIEEHQAVRQGAGMFCTPAPPTAPPRWSAGRR